MNKNIKDISEELETFTLNSSSLGLRIAFETNHSQRAVDRYIKDFNRVKNHFFSSKLFNKATCSSLAAISFS